MCAQLTDLAHNLGPGEKLPTVLQLRDSLGVSVATLNSALSELEDQKVLHRRHGVGIFVSSQLHHRRIVLVCDPSFFRTGVSPFWDMLIAQSRERAEAREEEFSLHFARPAGYGEAPLHEGLIGDIEAGRVNGILAVGLAPEAADWIIARRVPLVAFAGPGRYLVVLDGEEAVRLGVDCLARQGCRRIGFWSAVAPFRPTDSKPFERTSQGQAFLETLAKHGLEYDPRLVKTNRPSVMAQSGFVTTETHAEQGFRTAQAMFVRGDAANRPDGVFSADDMLTQGALTVLAKEGVRVGSDVQIATHANVGSRVLLGWEKEMTLIEVDPAKVVQAMFDLLETLMDGKEPGETIQVILPRLRTI